MSYYPELGDAKPKLLPGEGPSTIFHALHDAI